MIINNISLVIDTIVAIVIIIRVAIITIMVLISHHKNNNTSWQGYDNGSNKNDDNYNYDGCNVETRKIV